MEAETDCIYDLAERVINEIFSANEEKRIKISAQDFTNLMMRAEQLLMKEESLLKLYNYSRDIIVVGTSLLISF